ncbi:hypothetical protein FS837_003307 [Tulasnella sp. UAMH 9824]|nr:hypothetical protein FS837_003307 [Tulasnella sp. UAMH 9824]
MSDQSPSQDNQTKGTSKGRRPRTLVLCFDGTGNQFRSDKNTNVVLLFKSLVRNKPDEQLVYYQTGIGTYVPPGIMSRAGAFVAQMLDEAFAWYLEDHVAIAAHTLQGSSPQLRLVYELQLKMSHRALAGMLYRVGLLPPRNAEQVPFAYKIFKDARKEMKYRVKDETDSRGWVSENFLKTFSRKVDVEDTVASVGFIPRTLPNTRKNKIVRHVRHALALDERRAKFQASYWIPSSQSTNVIDTTSPNDLQSKDRTVKEVWFAGGHGDVGGGWEPQQKQAQLSRIPFRWMIREAMECTEAIRWDEGALQEFGVKRPKDSEGLAKYRNQEREDAISKFHSAFRDPTSWLLWLILEFIPLLTTIEFLSSRFRILGPHLFRPRKIREPSHDVPTRVHSSVKTRLKHMALYQNAAQWDDEMTEFVDEWAVHPDVLLFE